VAIPSGQRETAFRLVALEGQFAAFENLGHDFPQRIEYQRDGDRLTAAIEGPRHGATRRIEFPYLRTKVP
jgi:hypothetical protein